MTSADRLIGASQRRGAIGLAVALVIAAMLTGATHFRARAASEVYPVPASGAWSVDGAGWGHGIGLSQWGAQGAALDGLRPDQILSFYYPGTSFGYVGNPTIRVQLTGYQGGTIVFGAYGNEQLTATDLANGKSQVLPEASRYSLTVDSSWLHLNRLTNTGWVPIALAGQVNIGGPIDITAPSGTWLYSSDMSGNGRQYWGTMRFVRTSDSAAQAVNVLSMDAYLKFVVPRESPSSFHINALQSQAIAARSYALSVSHPGGSWDICDTTACQVYGGRATVAPDGSVTWLEAASSSKAVDYTSGIALAEPGGAVAFTQFSASNGGYSVKGSKPYLVAQPDPYSGKAPGDHVSRWSATLSASTVGAKCPSGTLKSFEITGRDGNGPFGGRITSIKINCTLGSTTLTSGLNLGMLSQMWKPTGDGGATIGNLETLGPSSGGIHLKGWASGGDGSTALITVAYRTSENRQMHATLDRPDVGAAYPSVGSRHGFDFVAPAQAGTTLVCVWADANGNRIQLGCANVNPPPGAPMGILDSATGVAASGGSPAGIAVSGWAFDPDTSSPIDVHLYWGTGATPVTANASRPDVDNVYHRGPNHGFTARVTAPSGSSGELCAYAINVPGPSDNPLLGCRTYSVP